MQRRIADEQEWPDLRGPPASFIPSLLPMGSLSPIGGPWQRYAEAPSMVPAPRDRPQANGAPRFGHPEGYAPLHGLYY
jgi:hypothetical protein